MTAGLRTIVLGGKELADRLKKAGKVGVAAARAGVYNVGLEILRPAIRNAPKKWGVLRGSGHVTLPTVEGVTISCTIGFGGPAQAYAAIQHEKQFKNYTESGTGPKYLEKAVEAVAPRAADIFARIIAKALAQNTEPTVTAQAPTSPTQGPQGRPKGGGKRSGGSRRKRRG